MVTKEDIKKIAALSRLYVAEEDLDALAVSMSDILSFADQITAAEVEPAPQDDGYGLEVLRDDISTASPDRSETLSNAKTSDGEYFVLEVKKRG